MRSAFIPREDIIYLDQTLCRIIENTTRDQISTYYWDLKAEFELKDVEELIKIANHVRDHEDLGFTPEYVMFLRRLCQRKGSNNVIFRRDPELKIYGFGWFQVS